MAQANDTGSWTLELLGTPRLTGPSGPIRLERRTAALLAYLGLEGPQPKNKLAGLLWPDSPEKTARSNLRQLLHRFKRAAGQAPLLSGDPLGLSPLVRIDTEPARGGQLLSGLVLDDSPELSQWLEGTRRELERTRLSAALAEAERLEKSGELAGAIAQARAAVALDPLCEQAHRLLMRLLYLLGDRAAALASFERCRSSLRQALGVVPSAETVRLSEEIARGRRVPPRRPAAPNGIPLSIQRPPLLAGREREWARMEEAWETGKGIMISGAPGVGKTRLMQDFMTAHSHPLFFCGRPGDRAVPYGTHARTYREMLEAAGGAEGLAAWARRELSRMLPQLGPPPGPIESEEDKLRFWQAKIEAHKLAIAHGFNSLGFDDLQYVDPASAASGQYVLSQLAFDQAGPLRTVHCFRQGELPEDLLRIVHELSDAGQIVLLQLEPIDPPAVEQLLASLEVQGLGSIARQVAHYAGGNPLFILETVKHLIESGNLERGFPDSLPPPGRVGPILKRRLERLSPSALQLSRALAVLGNDFTVEVAAQVLSCDPLEVERCWSELESAQLVRGSSFHHDLICEAVQAGMHDLVRQHLHQRAAVALEAAAAPPGAVASHLMQAGQAELAAAKRVEAEAAARTTMLREEAAGYSQRLSS